MSRFRARAPRVLGLTAFVVGGDDRLLLRNLSRQVIVIRGYEGEPYLRFTPRGVFANARLPATYLNRFRLPRRPAPAHADPTAAPEWRRVSAGRTYQWHDYRIHWMRGEPPPAVGTAPGRPHTIFDWRVPGTADGRPFAVAGVLGYAPEEAQTGSRGWIVPSAIAGGVLALAALFVRARMRR